MTAENRDSVRLDTANPRPSATPLFVHLSGPHRGTTQPLTASRLVVGTSAGADVHFPEDWGPPVAPRHATLLRHEDSYLLQAEPEAQVRVNGEPVESHLLAADDLLEFGPGGPVIRYRIHYGSGPPHKSISEVLADCVGCARYGSDTPWGRAGLLLASMPRELLTQTGRRSRTVILLMIVLAATTALLTVRTIVLEKNLAAETARLRAAAQLLTAADARRLTTEEIEQLRRELNAGLSERVQALEMSREALPAVIARASKAVVFLQGAYGFLDPQNRKPLRTVSGPDGQLVVDAAGLPIVTSEGDGPVLEKKFTGTGFFVSSDGLLLTNRHVARPWEYDDVARSAIKQGLVPVMRQLIGYLSQAAQPFEAHFVAASESADLAVLRSTDAASVPSPLTLHSVAALTGQDVIVLGYPTGIRALLARTNQLLVDSILRETEVDFWAVARRLSDGGHIAPLATRGIVGQVTPDMVVYDAETTRGGSGGPVLTVDGQVLAITVGILPEFGGSNLGVPAEQARLLLAPYLEQSSKEKKEGGGGG